MLGHRPIGGVIRERGKSFSVQVGEEFSFFQNEGSALRIWSDPRFVRTPLTFSKLRDLTQKFVFLNITKDVRGKCLGTFPIKGRTVGVS